MSETSLRMVAHGAVESTRRLDAARDKGKMHVDPPQEFTFGDFIDIINPLQHLPVISLLYREITGDEIKPAMRILGDLAYGGPTGFMFSTATVLFEEISGDDVVGHALALLDGDDDSAGAAAEGAGGPRQLASADGAGPPGRRADAEAMAVYASFVKPRGSSR